MGILNATPDSFHAGSRVAGVSAADEAVRMVREGAAILDVGGQSSRPGAERAGAAAATLGRAGDTSGGVSEGPGRAARARDGRPAPTAL